MARREYARIGTDMPDEPSIRALDVEPQWLYDRFLLRPDMSRCGVIPYRPGAWADLGNNATQTKVRRWLTALENSRHVVVDERYAEVLCRTYVRHDGLLAQPNVVAAMASDYRLILSPLIRLAFLAEFRRLWDLDISGGARGGWLLAVGQYPRARTGNDKTTWPDALPPDALARIRKAVGEGLAGDITQAIAEGSVRPFAEDSAHGIPEPFTEHPRARASGERRSRPYGTPTGSVSRVPDADPDPIGEPADEPAPPSRLPAVNGTHPPDVDQLLDQAGIRVPAIRAKLAAHVTPLLTSEIPTTAIVAGLRDWCTRDRAGPGLLPHLVHDQLTASQRVDPRFAGLIADRDAERTAR